MKTVILINGQKRSGKDFTAKILEEKLGSVLNISFAQPLKDIIRDTFGVTNEFLDDAKNFKVPLYVKHGNSLDECENTYHQITDFRTILQRFGTEGMKPRFGEAVWANVAISRISDTQTDFVLIPDFRFNIEFDVINSVGYRVITLKIDNKDIDTSDSHASERELDEFKFDYVIDNTGYSPRLEQRVDEFIREFGLLDD